MEAYSSDTWNDDGIGGLIQVLMQNGYLPLLLPELTRERLERAGLLISIAPARRFSSAERAAVGEFVRAGGTFICMVGSEEVAASRQMLKDDFDFDVLPSPVPPGSKTHEPVPLGSFPLNIKRQDSEVPLQTFAAWEVKCTAKGGWKEWATSSDGKRGRPFIVSRRAGLGHVAVIGDTYFATNQNLEYAADVTPKNVIFWRWFLTCVTDREEWIPPKPDPETEPPGELPPEDPTIDDSAGDEVAP